ncbi:MAG: YicC/YloC family endoribonuclease [Faecousia sp.]
MALIKSMTGYGRAVETINGREYTVELRSVNNRYLDCSVKLSRTLSFAEDAVKQAVKACVSRGKVDVFITMKSEAGDDTTITLNKAVVEGYLAAMRRMVEDCGVKDDISVSVLSRLPEVFTVEKPEADEQQLLSDLMCVVNKALDGYDVMRQTEGAALDADLRSRGNTILELVAQVEQGNAQTVVDYRTRLENKLKEVLAATNIDESRILTEAAIFADKVAVDEETVRLRSHLKQMNTMLSSGGAVGRKLDFLLQEMNREANTIGSKCTDVKLARIVVDIKAELEKIREQTQNIE